MHLLRATADGLVPADDVVAVEEPLEIRISYEKPGGLRVTRSISVTMRTPGQDAELALGFLLGEGLIADPAQVEGAAPAEANTVLVSLRPGVVVDLRPVERNFYATSSCGVCGKASLDALQSVRPARLDPDRPIVPVATLLQLPDRLRPAQSVFARTGGLHAAGLFDATGSLVCVREDVGRHNAVDKVIGAQFLAGRTRLADRILVVSGRASFELMQKALIAGIPMLVAVGAPSSLAVELARQSGATLAGFVREGRLNLYSGAQRVLRT